MQHHKSGVLRRRIAQQQRRMRHRLLSIASDASFVRFVAEHHPNIPVFANLRCGLWYARVAGVCAGTAYFKSTDGHANTWNFSLRRLNLNVIEAASSHDQGVMLVDATKRGRRLPDAFSRTVPIWCTVINRAVQKYRRRTLNFVSSSNSNEFFWDVELHVPPRVVSDIEKSTITTKLDSLVVALEKSGVVNIEWLSKKLGKRPLRSFWITTESHLVEGLSPDYSCRGKYSPVICVSASEPLEESVFRFFRVNKMFQSLSKPTDNNHISSMVPAANANVDVDVVDVDVDADVGFFYIPGAGDDHEKWCTGLTPNLFYLHLKSLLAACRDGDEACERLVSDIVDDLFVPMSLSLSSGEQNKNLFDVLGLTTLCIGSRSAGKPPEVWEKFDAVVSCTLSQYMEMGVCQHEQGSLVLGKYLHLPIPEGKRDSQNILLALLPKAVCFVLCHLSQGRRVLLHCNQGVDRSVGIAAAIVALCVNKKGHELYDLKSWCASATWDSLTEERRNILFDQREDVQNGSEKPGKTPRDCLNEWLKEVSRDDFDTVNVDKHILRATLVAITTYRKLASPSRYTMRKLSRFFTEKKMHQNL